MLFLSGRGSKIRQNLTQRQRVPRYTMFSNPIRDLVWRAWLVSEINTDAGQFEGFHQIAQFLAGGDVRNVELLNADVF